MYLIIYYYIFHLSICNNYNKKIAKPQTKKQQQQQTNKQTNKKKQTYLNKPGFVKVYQPRLLASFSEFKLTVYMLLSGLNVFFCNVVFLLVSYNIILLIASIYF